MSFSVILFSDCTRVQRHQPILLSIQRVFVDNLLVHEHQYFFFLITTLMTLSSKLYGSLTCRAQKNARRDIKKAQLTCNSS